MSSGDLKTCRNLYLSSFCLYSHRGTCHPAYLFGGKPTMTQPLPPTITKVTYHRIYADAQGGSHFDTVTVEQSSCDRSTSGCPVLRLKGRPRIKASLLYVSARLDRRLAPLSHPAVPCPHVGSVEMETTDGTKRRFKPGDLVLLEDTRGKGHVTRNIGDGYASYLVVPVPA